MNTNDFTEIKNIKQTIFISLVIFSLFYWIAAIYKPFHMDEFYSWVYAERCTFRELLQLKEFGIGHPPLYHIIQKFIQTVFQVYHPWQVRLANYFIGLLFITAIVKFFSKYKHVPLFFYTLSVSAAVLDTFVFSRMWGIVCLSSLLLLNMGEKYCKAQTWKNLVIFLGICALGFISDYNFILLLPYILLVLLNRKKLLKYVLLISFITIFILWIFGEHGLSRIHSESVNVLFYNLFYNTTKLCHELTNLIFNFWYEETLLLGILLFWLIQSKAKDNINKLLLLIITYGTISYIFTNYNLIRARAFIPIVLLLLPILFVKLKLLNLFKSLNFKETRILIAIAGALIILLFFNTLSWRELTLKRFLSPILPFVLYYIYLRLNKRTLHFVSTIFIISGLLYIFSKGVSDGFGPPASNKITKIIFQNAQSYSNQYLTYDKNSNNEAVIIETTEFNQFCVLCRMGTSYINFKEYYDINLIAKDNFDYRKLIPNEFKLIENKINLSLLDKLQLRYLTPIYENKYGEFIFSKNKRKI
ncbi:MAG: hypothetical protein WC549_03810 [Actinomycetota bacterium]